MKNKSFIDSQRNKNKKKDINDIISKSISLPIHPKNQSLLIPPNLETAGNFPSVLLCLRICFISSEIPSSLLCCYPILTSFSFNLSLMFFKFKSSFWTFMVVAFSFFLTKSESSFSYFLMLSLNSVFRDRRRLHYSISLVF